MYRWKLWLIVRQKLQSRIEAGKSYDDSRTDGGMVPREMQKDLNILSLSSTFSFCQPLFSVALGQHRRSCSTVIHFSPHSFTLLCLLSVLACHHDQTGPRLFFSFSAAGCAARPRKHHELFIREVHWEEHLRIPVNVLDFPRSRASLRPFTLSRARCKDED